MVIVPIRIYLIIISAIINLVLVFFILSLPKSPLVAFLSVGQGDSILLQDSDLTQILIDVGPGSKTVYELKKIVPFFDKIIELVIISHPEKDHFGGLFTLLKYYKINKVLLTGAVKNTPEFKNALNELKNAGINIGLLYKDVNIKTKNFHLQALWPLTSLLGINLWHANNASAVLLVQIGSEKLLLTGDIEKVVEEKIADLFAQDLNGSILKISHHGSKTSTSPTLLKVTKPKLAIISVGKNNSYNHPSREILTLLNKYQVPVWRTDLSGTLKFLIK